MDQTTISEVKTGGGLRLTTIPKKSVFLMLRVQSSFTQHTAAHLYVIMEQKKQTLRRIMDWIILWIMDWHSLENLRPVKKAKDKALA